MTQPIYPLLKPAQISAQLVCWELGAYYSDLLRSPHNSCAESWTPITQILLRSPHNSYAESWAPTETAAVYIYKITCIGLT